MKKVLLTFPKYGYSAGAGAKLVLLAAFTSMLLAHTSVNAVLPPTEPVFDGVAVYAAAEPTSNYKYNYKSGVVGGLYAARYGVPGLSDPKYVYKNFSVGANLNCTTDNFGGIDFRGNKFKSCEVSVPATSLQLIWPAGIPERQITISPQFFKGGRSYTPVVIDEQFDTIVTVTSFNKNQGYILVPAGTKAYLQEPTDPNGVKDEAGNADDKVIKVWKTLPKNAAWASARETNTHAIGAGKNVMPIGARNGFFRYGVRDQWFYTKVINGVIDSKVTSLCGGNPYPGMGMTGSCQVLVEVDPVPCAAAKVDWPTGIRQISTGVCSGSSPQLSSGQSAKILNTGEDTGSITATCRNGSLNYTDESCFKALPNAACSAGISSWKSNGGMFKCTGLVMSGASGSSTTVATDPRDSTVGSQTLQCNNGIWESKAQTCEIDFKLDNGGFCIGGVCPPRRTDFYDCGGNVCFVPVPPNSICDGQTVNWTGTNGAACTAQSNRMKQDDSVTLRNTPTGIRQKNPNIGSVKATCTSGSLKYTNATCAVPKSCGAETKSWTGTSGESCGGTVGPLLSGTTNIINNTLNSNIGSETASCNNGLYTISNQTCTRPPAAKCSAGIKIWKGNNGETCSATVGGLDSGSSVNVVNTLPTTTGTATMQCNNGDVGTTAKTCTVAQACPAATPTWSGAGGATCSGPVSATASGTKTVVYSTAWPNTGNETLSCNGGNWIPSNPTCVAPATSTVPDDPDWGDVGRRLTGDLDPSTTPYVARRGNATGWVYRPIAANMAAACTEAFFGSNPSTVGVQKCQAPRTPNKNPWVNIGSEYARQAISGSLLVRFGSEDNLSYQLLEKGAFVCNPDTLGQPGKTVVKNVCQILADAPQWADVAREGVPFKVNSSSWVRYGYGESWYYRRVNGGVYCDAGAFGGDPAPNYTKTCQMESASEVWTKVVQEYRTLPDTTFPQFYRFGVADQYAAKRIDRSGLICDAKTFGSDPAFRKAKSCYRLDAFSASFDPGTDPVGIKPILATETADSPLTQNTARALYQMKIFNEGRELVKTQKASGNQIGLAIKQRSINPNNPAARLQAYLDDQSPIFMKGNLNGTAFTSTQDKTEKAYAAVQTWLTTKDNGQTGMDVLTNLADQAIRIANMQALVAADKETDDNFHDGLRRRLAGAATVIPTGSLLATAVQLRMPNYVIPISVGGELYGNVRVSFPMRTSFGVDKDGKKREGYNVSTNSNKGRLNFIVSLETGVTLAPTKKYYNEINQAIPGTKKMDYLKGLSLGFGFETHFSLTKDTKRNLTRLDSVTIDLVADGGNLLYTGVGVINDRFPKSYYAAPNTTVGEELYRGLGFLTSLNRGSSTFVIPVREDQLRDTPPTIPTEITAPNTTSGTTTNNTAHTNIETIVINDFIPTATVARIFPNTAGGGYGATVPIPALINQYSSDLDLEAGNMLNRLNTEPQAPNNSTLNTLNTEMLATMRPSLRPGEPPTGFNTKLWMVDTIEFLVAATWFSPSYAEDLKCMGNSTGAGQCDSTFKTGDFGTNVRAPDVVTVGLISLNGLQSRAGFTFWENGFLKGVEGAAAFLGATVRFHAVSGGLLNFVFSNDAAYIVRSTGIANVLTGR
jgi:hypothetical protein